MSIKNEAILATETVILTAAVETAVLAIIFCNTDTVSRTVSVHAKLAGAALGDENIILKDIGIPGGDSFIWSGDEKLLLDATDVVSAIADAVGITATLSYKTLA